MYIESVTAKCVGRHEGINEELAVLSVIIHLITLASACKHICSEFAHFPVGTGCISL